MVDTNLSSDNISEGTIVMFNNNPLTLQERKAKLSKLTKGNSTTTNH